MKRTLLVISEDLHALDSLLFETGGDVSDPRIEAAVNEWIQELGDDLRGKTDNYCALIVDLEARAQFHAEEAARMAERSQSEERQADFLRQKLKCVLELRQMPKLETPRFRLSLQKNPPPLLIDPTAELPAHFIRVVPERREPDKVKLREALKQGQVVEGVTLGQPANRLSIR